MLHNAADNPHPPAADGITLMELAEKFDAFIVNDDEKPFKVPVTFIPEHFSLTSELYIPIDSTSDEISALLRERPQTTLQLLKENYSPPKPLPSTVNRRNDLILGDVHLFDYMINAGDFSSEIVKSLMAEGAPILIRRLALQYEMDMSVFQLENLVRIDANAKVYIISHNLTPNDKYLNDNQETTWKLNYNRTESTVSSLSTNLANHGLKIIEGVSDGNCQKTSFVGIPLGNLSCCRALLAELIKIPQCVNPATKNKTNACLSEKLLTYLNRPEILILDNNSKLSARFNRPCSAKININVGFAPCTWFVISHKYLGNFEKMCRRRDIDYHTSHYWPNMSDLENNSIPVSSVIQTYGDVIVLPSGCIYWMIADGLCTLVDYHIPVIHESSYEFGLLCTEFHRDSGLTPHMPFEHFSWILGQNRKEVPDNMLNTLRAVLIRSFTNNMMIKRYLKHKKKEIIETRVNPENMSGYCNSCYQEIFNYFFLLKNANTYHCIYCAVGRDFDKFTVMERYDVKLLARVLDAFPSFEDEELFFEGIEALQT